MDLDSLAYLRLLRDTEPAGWLADELWPWGPSDARVGSFVPASLAAHARVLHPAGGDAAARWAQLAASRGVAVGPATSFADASGLVPDTPAWDDAVPLEGSLPPSQLAVLRDVLMRYTSSAGSCRFMFWDGWGIYGAGVGYDVTPGMILHEHGRRAAAAAARVEPQRRYMAAIPRVHLPNRTYLLFEGPLDAPLDALYLDDRSPNAWWPRDRRWFVATEVDGYDTYVGGPAEAIDAILATPDLEAIRVAPGDPVPGW